MATHHQRSNHAKAIGLISDNDSSVEIKPISHDKPGYFITLEGGEGAGKTTLLHQMAAYFSKRGLTVLTTREPGGSQLGETIRNWLLTKDSKVKIGHQAELLLFLASRAQHIEEKILPALQSGHIVLCDRFNDSTVAYQGGARGLGIEHVQKLCNLVCGRIIPNVTFYLKVSPDVGLSRSKRTQKETAASGEFDRIESESLLFHTKIEESFEYLAKKEAHRIFTIDANKAQELVFQEVISICTKKIVDDAK